MRRSFVLVPKMNVLVFLSTAMTVVMVFGISMAGIDMIASMMLLAGAVLVSGTRGRERGGHSHITRF